MKPLNQMTRYESLNYILARAGTIEKELRKLFDDLTVCENRWPGQFTAQELQAFSEMKIAEAKVASLRSLRDQEAAK